MTAEQIADELSSLGFEDSYQFPDLAEAAVGISHDGRVIYDHAKIVEIYEADGMTEEDAEDYISYNCIRTIDNLGEHAPIIMYPFDE